MCAIEVRRPHTASQSVWCVIRDVDRLLLVLERVDRDDRPEYLLDAACMGDWQAGQDGRLDEGARIEGSRQIRTTTADQDLSTVATSKVDVALNLETVIQGRDRTEIARVRVATFQLRQQGECTAMNVRWMLLNELVLHRLLACSCCVPPPPVLTFLTSSTIAATNLS